MRILHVVTLVDDNASYGGPLTVALNQCRQLRVLGHDAEIIAGWRGQGRPPEFLEGVPAHLFSTRSLIPGLRFSGLFSERMLFWLGKNARQYEVAHLHLARDLVPLTAGALLRSHGIPFVTQTHGMIGPDPRMAAQFLDFVLTVPILKAAHERFVLISREETELRGILGDDVSIACLPNGIAGKSDTWNPPKGVPDALFLSRLHPRKRVVDFMQAAEHLVHQGVQATFSIVGPDDGDLATVLRFLETRPELESSVKYEGALRHDMVLDRMRLATMFVLPSVDEPFPMALLESLSLGIPSICTASCGLANELARLKAAVVVRPGAESIAEAIGALLARPAEQHLLSDAALHASRVMFSMEHVGACLANTYSSSVERATSLSLRRPVPNDSA